VSNEWYYANIALIEYYTKFWWSFLNVFLAPIWLIVMWTQGWNLSDINYNQTAWDLGLEWIQDSYINNFTKKVEYHYMRYAVDYPTNTAEDGFVKTLIFFGVWILDVLTLLSGVISNTVGLPFELYFILVEIIIQTNKTAKQRFFGYFGLSGDTYLYTAT